MYDIYNMLFYKLKNYILYKNIIQYIILNFIVNLKLKKVLKIYKISLNDRYLHK